MCICACIIYLVTYICKFKILTCYKDNYSAYINNTYSIYRCIANLIINRQHRNISKQQIFIKQNNNYMKDHRLRLLITFIIFQEIIQHVSSTAKISACNGDSSALFNTRLHISIAYNNYNHLGVLIGLDRNLFNYIQNSDCSNVSTTPTTLKQSCRNWPLSGCAQCDFMIVYNNIVVGGLDDLYISGFTFPSAGAPGSINVGKANMMDEFLNKATPHKQCGEFQRPLFYTNITGISNYI